MDLDSSVKVTYCSETYEMVLNLSILFDRVALYMLGMVNHSLSQDFFLPIMTCK